MPHETAKVTDIRTSPIAERIAAVNDFVDAGYEVHLNFSPVILTPTWESDWAELLRQVDDVLSPAAKAQLAAEVIFLTHNEPLHEVNLGWQPKGGGPAVAAGPAGAEGLAERRRQRPVTARG